MTTYEAKSPLTRFLEIDLKWCGCGNPEKALEYMRDVLRLLEARSAAHWDKESNAAIDAVMDTRTGLGISYAYMLEAADLTEHGGSVHGLWLSDKGKQILAALNAVEDWDDALDDIEVTEEEWNKLCGLNPPGFPFTSKAEDA
jgi:hypothetical protein